MTEQDQMATAQQEAAAMMDQTINDRTGTLDQQQYEETKGEENQWMEVRLQGKLPERRSNHCGFIFKKQDEEFLYVHGGRDLKEGSISTMWRVNLNGILQLQQDPYYPVEWELVQTSGRSPGKISHHKATVLNAKDVLIYGGLKGEDSNPDVFILNALAGQWTTIQLSKQSGSILPRDDHVMSDCSDGSFLVFGGFVKGSRVDELMRFNQNGVAVDGDLLAGGESDIKGPIARASHASVCYQDKLYVFGGQDDDNNKLGDLWEFDPAAKKWTEICQGEGDFVPKARSGHTAVCRGDKMYIFGGIFELTKELNDMVIYDFKTKKYVEADSSYEPTSPEKSRAAVENQSAYQDASPTRTGKGGSPDRRRRTLGASSPYSPNKKKRLISPSKTTNSDLEGVADGETAKKKDKKDGLSSPTSISMRDSFIIKQADQSFDAYHAQMKKRRQQGFTQTYGDERTNENKFGLINGSKPTARDGHIAITDSQGFMYVFGGDRHLMPFNDLYMIKLQ